MTPLRQRMADAMLQRGFAASTRENYVKAIYGMAKYYRRDPAGYSASEVQAYLLHMVKERHVSFSSMNQTACAARFLYETVLGHNREQFHIPMAKVPVTQPELPPMPGVWTNNNGQASSAWPRTSLACGTILARRTASASAWHACSSRTSRCSRARTSRRRSASAAEPRTRFTSNGPSRRGRFVRRLLLP